MKQMPKPVFLWVDLTVATSEAELSPLFGESFNIQTCVDNYHPEVEIEQLSPSGVCYDFDYPDRRRLSHVVRLKERFPSLPMLVMTVQQCWTIW
jgi:hypothetical protein